MKVDMKNTDYFKSGKQTENVLKARELALVANCNAKKNREFLYLENPTLCANCNFALPYVSRKNKFCCKSCSATFNNIGRKDSESTKKKKSDALKNVKKNYVVTRGFCDVYFLTCKVCGKITTQGASGKDKKTCGDRDCKTYASTKNRTYQNGSRKPVWYFNPFEGKEVLLESSWEVEIADLLIELNIEWIRPTPIKWFDINNKSHLYYPDFYLVRQNIYLDPKNPYCVEKDKEKLLEVQKQIVLIFGDIQIIKDYISFL